MWRVDLSSGPDEALSEVNLRTFWATPVFLPWSIMRCNGLKSFSREVALRAWVRGSASASVVFCRFWISALCSVCHVCEREAINHKVKPNANKPAVTTATPKSPLVNAPRRAQNEIRAKNVPTNAGMCQLVRALVNQCARVGAVVGFMIRGCLCNCSAGRGPRALRLRPQYALVLASDRGLAGCGRWIPMRVAPLGCC